jgi:hypothetical protein
MGSKMSFSISSGLVPGYTTTIELKVAFSTGSSALGILSKELIPKAIIIIKMIMVNWWFFTEKSVIFIFCVSF